MLGNKSGDFKHNLLTSPSVMSVRRIITALLKQKQKRVFLLFFSCSAPKKKSPFKVLGERKKPTRFLFGCFLMLAWLSYGFLFYPRRGKRQAKAVILEARSGFVRFLSGQWFLNLSDVNKRCYWKKCQMCFIFLQ